MIIDITKCNGYYNCQIACKDEHVGNDWTPIAKPQPRSRPVLDPCGGVCQESGAQGKDGLYASYVSAL